MMTNQTYQELSRIIEGDLKRLKKRGVKTLDEIDVHNYFFERKKRHPEKYERLLFDTNGHKPFSEDLQNILSDFRICGILCNKHDIISE